MSKDFLTKQKNPHTLGRQTSECEEIMYKKNHSKGHFLIPILSKSEVKINVDGRIAKRQI